jgi:hypothetical protein
VTPPPVNPELLERIEGKLRADLRPVRPRPAAGVLAGVLVAIVTAVAVWGARTLGFYGWRKMGAGEAMAIFVPLLVAVAILAIACVNAKIPGARRLAHPAVLLAAACVVMVCVFTAAFGDRRTDGFVRQGWPCLRAGLMWAGPAALALWLVLRRGFAVDARAAGVAIGGLAGLAGLTMLELHCPNFRLAHIAVWHTAAVPIAAAVGYVLGGAAYRGRSRLSGGR